MILVFRRELCFRCWYLLVLKHHFFVSSFKWNFWLLGLDFKLLVSVSLFCCFLKLYTHLKKMISFLIFSCFAFLVFNFYLTFSLNLACFKALSMTFTQGFSFYQRIILLSKPSFSSFYAFYFQQNLMWSSVIHFDQFRHFPCWLFWNFLE